MTFYNHIESVRGIAIDLTNGRKWRGASDKAAVFDALDAARREYIRLSDENAKLREFVAGMWRLFVEHCAVDESRLAEVDAVRDGLCELGIDVDE